MGREEESLEEKHRRLKKRLRWGIGLAILGLLDSAWLLFLHLNEGALSSVCSAGAGISCDVLQIPTYSEWFGIPVPVFSLLFYTLALAAALDTLRKNDRQAVRPYVYLWMLSWVAVGAAVYMGYISIGILHKFCPFCAVLYAVNIGLWVVHRGSLRIVNQPWGYLVSSDLRNAHRSRWVLGSAAAAAVTLALSHFLFKQTGQLTGPGTEIAAAEARTLGPVSAPTTVTVFSDFQCPHCKVAAEMLRQLEEQMRGKVRIVYKFYPLDPACNTYAPWGKHESACLASEAAYCAGLQGKFWPYHDFVFANQTDLGKSQLYWFAREVNLDLAAFDRCWHDARTVEAVKADIAEGARLKLEGTPTIFINGQKYKGPHTVSGLLEAIFADHPPAH